MCEFNQKASSNFAAGAATQILSGGTLIFTDSGTKYHCELDIPPLLWQHTVTRAAHTVGQEDGVMVGILAGCVLPVFSASTLALLLPLKRMATQDRALCLGTD